MKEYRGDVATAALARASSNIHAQESTAPYAEVWGDTVDLRHLGLSIALGIGFSTGAFFAGKHVLSSLVADAAIARAYAMLIGLAGCLIAGAICAFLFAPKRDVVEQTSDESERIRVLDQLAAEFGGLGSVEDLSSGARAELSELGLLDLFASHQTAPTSTLSIDGTRQGERR